MGEAGAEGRTCLQGALQEQEAVPREGAEFGGCESPLGEAPSRQGCGEACIPWGLDAVGHGGMLLPALAAGEGASTSPSPSITAADTA